MQLFMHIREARCLNAGFEGVYNHDFSADAVADLGEESRPLSHD